MVTTGGVLGTPWPLDWLKRDPNEPRLGVVTGELWLVAGEETGDDSPLRAEPEEGESNDSRRVRNKIYVSIRHLIPLKRFQDQTIPLSQKTSGTQTNTHFF